MADNFKFVKEYDEKLYTRIHNAEALLKIDFVKAGAQLRSEVLESFVNGIINSFELKDEVKKYCESCGGHLNADTLSGKMRFLTDAKAISKLTDQPQRKDLKPLVCKHKNPYNGLFEDYRVSKTYTSVKGRKEDRKVEPDNKYINTFHFIRATCNACHHDPDDKEKIAFALTYENVLECFRIAYHIFACYFGADAQYGKYYENLIPLGDYEILSSFVPGDSDRTGCRFEHEAKKGSDGSFVKWAIIREYKKSEIDKNFFLRGYHTSIFAEYQLIDVPNAMIKVDTVTQFDDEKSPYYIVAYNFTREPYKLKDVISQIDLKNRYEICIRVAECFEKLHSLEKPIFHRMLNHNCIYVQNCNDVNRGWVASVIKFDFSKITSQETVFENYKRASGKTTAAEKKYLAPEWKIENTSAKWAQIDIYALGMLFYDVLCGKISESQPSAQAIRQTGVDGNVIGLINRMISPSYSLRPDIKEVVSVLKNINL